MEDDELIKEFRGMMQALKIDGFPKIHLRVTDGSYTVKVSNQKVKIDTVLNQSPIYRIRRTIQKALTTRNLDVRKKLVEKTIMDGVNLTFESGKNYLVLGAPGSGKVSTVNLTHLFHHTRWNFIFSYTLSFNFSFILLVDIVEDDCQYSPS